ncbi:MAG: hypothetical protein AMJ78_04370 [Omnitrophica WOR_2 bacterium SM23_29]|nr:MAG: hypothetical protein AMJ78_04370 [Omnitrophica WOR_2 bacterium SM23_29]
MLLVLSLLISYLIGSMPTSYILGKAMRGIDIRQFGSGNVGATNVYRVVGKLPGILVLIIDIAKGLICVTLIANLCLRLGISINPENYRLALGLAAVIGHDWTVFLKFKGGKGVATSSGVLIGIAPKIFLLGLLIWICVFLWKRYVSLASITSVVSVPIFFSILSYPVSYVIFSSCICAITVYKHLPNVKRLVRGEENKIIFRK